jgi:ATP adenylyltransferase
MTHPIWAPWRIEYIVGPKIKDGCIFCAYANRECQGFRSDLTLVRQEHAYVALNRYPFTAGHIMVIPRRHVAGIEELSEAEYQELFALVRSACGALRAAVRPDGLNVGINLGEAAGAGIAPHLHVHVVPRWAGDTNFMPVLADVRVMPQALDDTWKHLMKSFQNIDGEHGDPNTELPSETLSIL